VARGGFGGAGGQRSQEEKEEELGRAGNHAQSMALPA
jgi:hypothetical protein